MTRCAPIVFAMAIVSSSLLPSCSLMDLGDFGLDDCEQPEQCDVLNERDGLGRDDCVIWQCRPDKRGCEQRPRDLDDDQHPDAHACSMLDGPLDCADQDGARAEGLAESADHSDNDCDGLIDEDAPQQPVRLSELPLPGPEFLSYDQGEAGALHLLAGADGRGAQAWTLGADGDGEAHEVVYGFAGSSASRCQNRGDAPGSAGTCNFVELALSAVGDELIAAGVNNHGCGDGQLRVGIGRSGEFVFRAAAERGLSNVEWGANLDPAPREGEDPCTVVGEQPGARSPRVAALPAQSGLESQHALVAWLAASAMGDCARDADVVVLGLWPHTAPADGAARAPRWLQGGRGGNGEVIGRSAGCAAPSMAALRTETGRGYAIALARSDGVELLWIAQPNALGDSLDDLALRSSLAASAPQHLALALVPRTVSSRGWLVAWRSGEHAGELGFAPLALGATGLVADEPQHVRRSAQIVDGPVVAYARTGFALPALDSSESTGGWLLVWSEGSEGSASRLMGLRVADLTVDAGGARILGEPFELGEGDARFPFVCAAQGPGFDYGFVAMEGADGKLTRGRLK
jgi:hypothetical protein